MMKFLVRSLYMPHIKRSITIIIIPPMTNIIQNRVSLQKISSTVNVLAYIRKNMITVEVETMAMNRQ